MDEESVEVACDSCIRYFRLREARVPEGRYARAADRFAQAGIPSPFESISLQNPTGDIPCHTIARMKHTRKEYRATPSITSKGCATQ